MQNCLALQIMPSLPVIDVVTTVLVVSPGGQGPAVTVPRDDLGPTNTPLSVPPTMIVYVTPHSSPLTVTIAIPLVIGAVPEYVNVRTYIIVYAIQLSLICTSCTYAYTSA